MIVRNNTHRGRVLTEQQESDIKIEFEKLRMEGMTKVAARRILQDKYFISESVVGFCTGWNRSYRKNNPGKEI